MTTPISQDNTSVQCNNVVCWFVWRRALFAGWTLEGQLVYLFCIILANRKTPAEAQGTHQIWVPVTGNFTKYCACSSHNICFCCLGMVVNFMKAIFLQTKHEARYFVIGKMTHRKSRKSRLGDCKEDFMPWLPGSGQTIPHRGRTCSRRLKSGFCSHTHTLLSAHTAQTAHTLSRPHVTNSRPCVTVSSLRVTVSYCIAAPLQSVAYCVSSHGNFIAHCFHTYDT